MLLRMTAGFSGERIGRFRLIAGALLGAALAQAAREMRLGRAQTALLSLIAAALMTAAAFGWKRNALRRVLLLLSSSGLLGGTILALAGATGSLSTAYALGGASALMLSSSLVRARRAAQDVRSAEVVCAYRGITVRFEAMIDSGNTLRDYLTHAPVIVMPEETGVRLFGVLPKALRPIFADTAGGRQKMALLMPDKTVITIRGRGRHVRAAVALSGAMTKGAPILVPASLVEEESIPEGVKTEGDKGHGMGKEDGHDEADDAAGTGGFAAGGHGGIYRRKRLPARAADARGRGGAL